MKKFNSSKMKTVIIAAILLMVVNVRAQNIQPKIGIVKIESRGWKAEQPFTQLVRIELGKLNIYEVMDRYDIEDVMKQNNINTDECLNKDCILEAGKQLQADYMLGGSIEMMNNKVLIMFREIDMKTGNTQKTITKEFPDGAQEIEVLIEVSLKEMYGIKIDDVTKQNLDQKNAIANAVNNSKELTVSIGGPRFGFGFLTGTAAEFIKRAKEDGGYGGYPAMFQFGYQFEKMYLNEGNFQAMFEFLPTISGVDQGRFIPSFTFLTGFRSSKSGWEFAFGPTITWTKTANSYQDNTGKWHMEYEYQGDRYDSVTHIYSYVRNPAEIINRNDARGEVTAKPGILFAAGKTFKSGKLNMPLNFYVVPRKGALQFGVSYGFNTMKKKTGQ